MARVATDAKLACDRDYSTYNDQECAGGVFGTLFIFVAGGVSLAAGIIPSAMQPHQLKCETNPPPFII